MRLSRIVAFGLLYSITPCATAYASEPSSWGQFIGRIATEWDVDNIHFTLLEDFKFIDAKKHEWIANKGLKTDCASIPRVFWPLVGSPCQGVYRNAAVIHDRYCIDKKLASSDAVHEMFFNALMASGASKRRAYIMYSAVYVGGPHWRKIVKDDGTESIQEYRLWIPDIFVGPPEVMASLEALRNDDIGAVKDFALKFGKIVEPSDPRLEQRDRFRAELLKRHYDDENFFRERR